MEDIISRRKAVNSIMQLKIKASETAADDTRNRILDEAKLRQTIRETEFWMRQSALYLASVRRMPSRPSMVNGICRW